MENAYVDIDFNQEFDALYGSTILLPGRTIFYRGYDTRYPAVASRPTHFGTRSTASSYVKSANHALGVFGTTKPLRLMDLRYIWVILRKLFSRRVDNDETTLDPIVRTCIGYGLCSYADQLVYARRMYGDDLPGIKAMIALGQTFHGKEPNHMPLTVNPVTPDGIRIAETTNDGYICAFLSVLFDGKIDGFIAPRMETAFHVEKRGWLPGEIVVFDPVRSGIKQLTTNDILKREVSIQHVINAQSNQMCVAYKGKMGVSYRERKGGAGGGNPDDDPNAFIDKLAAGDKEAIALYNQAIRAGKKWKKQMAVVDPCEPHPTAVVRPWML